MYTDPIADLLTRIRNGYSSHKDNVVIPHSKQKMAILQVMREKKFINGAKELKNGKFKEIEIELNPNHKNLTLRKISKPGQRIYIGTDTIKKINGGLGLAIISTSKGIMDANLAKKQKLGGEVICEIY